MEAFKDNFIFCLFTGWILFAAAIVAVGVLFTDSDSDMYKYRHLAWTLVAAIGVIMFLLQNIFIYLY